MPFRGVSMRQRRLFLSRIRQEAKSKTLAFRKDGVKRFHLRRRSQKIIRIVKGIVPVGLYGRLHDDHHSAVTERIDAKKKAGFVVARGVDLFQGIVLNFVLLPVSQVSLLGKIVLIVRYKEFRIALFPWIGWKGHAKALMDMITVPEPQPPRPMPIGVVPYVDQETGEVHSYSTSSETRRRRRVSSERYLRISARF